MIDMPPVLVNETDLILNVQFLFSRHLADGFFPPPSSSWVNYLHVAQDTLGKRKQGKILVRIRWGITETGRPKINISIQLIFHRHNII